MKASCLVVVTGPTAVGKTVASIKLAQHLKTEIISADSRQVFREMRIGTARPTDAELALVPHHLIAHHAITDPYDAARFAEEAEAVLNTLFTTHAYAVLCGGSGLYVKALLEGFDDLPPVPPSVREEIKAAYEAKGLMWLQDAVAEGDPDYYEQVDRNNPQRLMRALEVLRGTGKPFSSFRKQSRKELPYRVVKIGLTLEREELYQRIDRRMDKMIADGLWEEAKQLYPHRSINALQTVGYQEVFDCLDGKYDKDEAIRKMKQNSRNYAKRQLTWFRRDAEITWFHPEDIDGMLKLIHEKRA
ncbi:MAG: tRNA (adenosine(37)-N6)-dimethylallyltransferase MiaA [Cyclobacteriaceae bacterium]